jgi:predicted dehydrogenase
MSLRWGILGAGGIAATFVPELRGGGFRVSAVGSRDLDTASSFAERFDIPTAHGSYADLVEDPEVDVVYIATPHVFHREHALLAIAAGKHVLVEKPFTVNAAEARDIFAAADRAGVVVLEAMWTRFLPQNRRLREILRSGVLGELRLFTGTHGQLLSDDPHHRVNDPTLGGGALLDLGVYAVAFALDVLGVPTGVHASAVLSDQGVDARVAIVLDHPSGARSMLYAALDTPMVNSGRIDGTLGRIELDDRFYEASGFTVFDVTGRVVERFESDEGGLRGMRHQAVEMERLVAPGASTSGALTPAGTIAVASVMDEVRRQIGVRYPSEDATRTGFDGGLS